MASSKSKVQRKSKRCTKCRQDKELSEFYRQPYRSDGHGYKCKDCSCQYNAERRKRPCGVSGCVRPHRSQGYCYFHWRQLREHGKILHRSGSLFDRNVIEQEGPIAYIHVIRENGGLLDKAIVDVADIPIVKNHKWHRDSSVGVSAAINGEKVQLTRHIMKPPRNMIVFHINHDTLDNRRANLRICNNQVSTVNQRLGRNNTSGVRGVYQQKGRWKASLFINGKSYFGGSHTDFDDAVMARKKLEEKHFKDLFIKSDSETIQ